MFYNNLYPHSLTCPQVTTISGVDTRLHPLDAAYRWTPGKIQINVGIVGFGFTHVAISYIGM